MTVTELDQEVIQSPPRPRRSRPGWRYAVAAVAGLAIGALAVFGGYQLASDEPAAAEPAAVRRLIQFDTSGNGQVAFAGIWSGLGGWPGEVDPDGAYTVTSPYTVVLTIVAEPGERATCRIYADEYLVEERVADQSVTCVSVRR